jgi:hypothetical protein
MLPTPILPESGLSAYVLTSTTGSLKQGLYALDGDRYQFVMPQPIISDILIKGSNIDLYLGLDQPITASLSAIVYKNGILYAPRLLEGNALFCVLSPQSEGETFIYVQASRNISGHRVIKATLAGADYASAAVPGDATSVIGVSTGAALAGEFVRVQTDGELSEPSWNWQIGPVYNDVDGLLTQTNPSAGYSLVVGIAIEPTVLLISVKQPIVLN